MNKSYSKIRHIQEANEKLEKRFLTEDKTAVVKPEVTVTPQVPSNLGFGIKDCPIGKLINYKTNVSPYDWESGIASTNIIIKPGAKITWVKKGQVQVPGLLYFRKDGKKAGEKVSDDTAAGPESSKGMRGKSIPKTIWYDCDTRSFYLWYDNQKIIYPRNSALSDVVNNKFDATEDWFSQKVCGTASQEELIAAFRVN